MLIVLYTAQSGNTAQIEISAGSASRIAFKVTWGHTPTDIDNDQVSAAIPDIFAKMGLNLRLEVLVKESDPAKGAAIARAFVDGGMERN